MKQFDEHEHLREDTLAKEAEWLEQEHFYEEERNRQLPAVIRVVIPTFKTKRNETIKRTNIKSKKRSS